MSPEFNPFRRRYATLKMRRRRSALPAAGSGWPGAMFGAYFSRAAGAATASSTASLSTASPSRRASSRIVRGGAIFTVCPQAPTGAKNSSPLWKQRSMMSCARSWFGSLRPGWVICNPPTRPRQL